MHNALKLMQDSIEKIVTLAGLIAYQKAPHKIPKDLLYKAMLKVDENHCITFEEFPTALKPIIGLYQGNIFTTKNGDTLQLICSFPDYGTVNRYLWYFFKDNHGNYWTMFHEEDDKYRIYSEDPNKAKNYFKDKQESLENMKWLISPSENRRDFLA